ncbi:MAG: multiheme c-type cytochrome, partial [Bryobacteraceae bacterium]
MRFHPVIFLLPMAAAAQDARFAGSKACAACHAEISRRYAATGMAQSSGIVGGGQFREAFAHAEFSDSAFGAKYRVTTRPGGYRLEFSRESSGVAGERRLQWFIGSGHAGRSYLFSLGGFLFQSPVSYYSASARWGVSPWYQRSSSINLTRPVEARCLQCHASRLDPIAGTENGFRDPPFLEGGIGCERCHGPGREHIARMSSGRGGPPGIVNPARLAPARRDSVCAQCHLTGAARIARLRPPHDVYQPGALLSDYSAFFVWSGSDLPAMKVASHFERLQQSRCKKASGDRLWCGTCHDPHGEPANAAYYRTRCETCHRPADCKASTEARAQRQDNCIACHMPKSPVADAQHAVYTDHSIPRRPLAANQSPGTARTLVPFWKTPADERDLALAYAAVGDGQRATALLQRAETRDPRDVA